MAINLLRRLRQELISTTGWLPLAAWLLLMVLIPVAHWASRDRGFVALTVTGILTQASAVLVVMSSQ